jgi:hypothetical protein
MNYTCAAREEAADHAADRLAAFAVRFSTCLMIARARFLADTGNGHIPTSLISSV